MQLLMGGKVNRFIPNPTFDPIIVPGCLDALFRGQIPEGVDPRTLMKVEPLRAEYRDRDKRARGDRATRASSRCCSSRRSAAASSRRCATTSTRRWRACTRSTAGSRRTGASPTEDRLIAAPMLSLADPDAACAELDSLLERGARIVHVRPAPVPARTAPRARSGDKLHDPVWARLAEASVPVAFHLGDSGYNLLSRRMGRGRGVPGLRSDATCSARIVVSDRAIHDTIASLVVDGVFTRHPGAAGREHRERLRLPAPPGEAAAQAGQPDSVGVPARIPLDTHPQARVGHAVLRGGPRRPWPSSSASERILFGSDWPHGEGLAKPLDFAKELARLRRRRRSAA